MKAGTISGSADMDTRNALIKKSRHRKKSSGGESLRNILPLHVLLRKID
jgi:hypothetical protein